MTDPLLEFIADSPNFGYLAPHSWELAGAGASAEAYVHVDPDATLARARRFGETVIDLGLTHFGMSVEGSDGTRMAFAKQRELPKASGFLPAHLEPTFARIIQQRNKAAHEYLRDREMAAAAVRACFDLRRW